MGLNDDTSRRFIGDESVEVSQNNALLSYKVDFPSLETSLHCYEHFSHMLLLKANWGDRQKTTSWRSPKHWTFDGFESPCSETKTPRPHTFRMIRRQLLKFFPLIMVLFFVIVIKARYADVLIIWYYCNIWLYIFCDSHESSFFNSSFWPNSERKQWCRLRVCFPSRIINWQAQV